MTFRQLSTVLSLQLIATFAACRKPPTKVSRVETREASTGGLKQVEIRNTNGSIRVLGFRSVDTRFKVTATKWAQGPGKKAAQEALKQVKLRIYRDQDKAIVVIKHPPPAGGTTYGADLKVFVPAELAVDVDSTKGSIGVFGIVGSVTARTVKGDIEGRGLGSRMVASTAAGKVVASGELGFFEVSTKQGDVRVNIRKRKTLSDASSAATGKGNILVTLSRDFNAQLSARAASGSISIPFPGLKTTGTSRTGTLGSGGKLLSLSTSRGTIRIIAKDYTSTQIMYRERSGMRKKRPSHQHDHMHPGRFPQGLTPPHPMRPDPMH
ncbi:MAG: DUF4097 family beta strand repeat-containing protein [bacterium]